MELDALDRQLAVAHAHDLALRARRRHLEHVRDAGRGARVVAAGLERRGQPRVQALSAVRHRARLAMHEPPRLADVAAEHLDDRLVAEADAERRDAWAEP